MRFCYIGHRLHERSKSTVFLLEILREIGEVDVFSSDPDAETVDDDDELVARVAVADYDCYVFLQTEYIAARLRPLGVGRLVIIPMYDGAHGIPDAFWRQFVHARFISFCRVHHEHLEALDCRSTSFQFYPEPRPVPARDVSKRTAFFWERRPDKEVNLGSVVSLCRQLEVTALHVHAAPDFARHARPTSRLNGALIDGVAITRSRWFDSRDEYEAVARDPLFFFAPRLQEGIGMAILEAMSIGQIVVAPDRPTVNEYVSHLTTGILYDPAKPKITCRLDSQALDRMSAAARQKIEFGRADWLADIDRLKSLLLDDGRRCSTRDVSSRFMNSLRRSASERSFGGRREVSVAEQAS